MSAGSHVPALGRAGAQPRSPRLRTPHLAGGSAAQSLAQKPHTGCWPQASSRGPSWSGPAKSLAPTTSSRVLLLHCSPPPPRLSWGLPSCRQRPPTPGPAPHCPGHLGPAGPARGTLIPQWVGWGRSGFSPVAVGAPPPRVGCSLPIHERAPPSSAGQADRAALQDLAAGQPAAPQRGRVLPQPGRTRGAPQGPESVPRPEADLALLEGRAPATARPLPPPPGFSPLSSGAGTLGWRWGWVLTPRLTGDTAWGRWLPGSCDCAELGVGWGRAPPLPSHCPRGQPEVSGALATP